MGTLRQPGPGPAMGETAPDFTLRHTFEHDVPLRDVLASGPTLLAFYVFDFGSI